MNRTPDGPSRTPHRLSLTLALFVTVFTATAAAAEGPDTSPALARADSLWQAEARPEAFAWLDEVVDTARADADTAGWVAALARRGKFLKQDSRAAEAETVLRDALSLASAAADPALVCAPQRWLGVVLTALGRNEEAATAYARLEKLAAAVGDTLHMAWASVGLGWDADLNRDHETARVRYGRAAALFAAAGDPEGELWAQLGEANAWFHLGRYETASAGWDRVARLAAQTGLARHEAITRNNIAGLQFALGRPDVSLRQYERAVAIWDSLDQQWERVPPALNLGSCLALLGQTDRARTLFSDELTACRAAGYTDYEARALRKLADLERDLGDYVAAAAHYREVLDLGDDRPVLERLDAWLGLASLAVADGDHAAAMSSLDAADVLLANDRTSQARIRLDLARARSLIALGRGDEADEALDRVDTLLGEARARFGLDLELRRADLCEARDDTDGAGEALARAAELWEQERGLPLDPDWRAERGAAGREIFVRLARRLARSDGADAAFDRLQSAKARTLREQVLGPGADEADDSQSVSAADLRNDLLAPGDLLLDAHMSPRGGVLFTVSVDTCLMTDLPADLGLPGRLRAWRDRLADPTTSAETLAADADSLCADLLAPLASQLAAAERVIVSPDGDLNLAPLSALVAADERTWIRIPSASLWRDLRTADDNAAAPASLTLLMADEDSSLRLPAARWQADHLESTYDDVDVQAGPLDADALAGLAGRVLHVGAHVRDDPENAWQSAVLLDDGPRGEWRAADVAAGRIGAPLVVLAGCTSGGGRLLTGEGVQGLAPAFLIAGARAVVATLWPVDDAQSARFMSIFYAHLADGETAGRALATTRAELRSDPATAHPFAWAGYVLLGDGNVNAPLVPARGAPSWATLIGIATFVAAALLWLRRRRTR